MRLGEGLANGEELGSEFWRHALEVELQGASATVLDLQREGPFLVRVQGCVQGPGRNAHDRWMRGRSRYLEASRPASVLGRQQKGGTLDLARCIGGEVNRGNHLFSRFQGDRHFHAVREGGVAEGEAPNRDRLRLRVAYLDGALGGLPDVGVVELQGVRTEGQAAVLAQPLHRHLDLPLGFLVVVRAQVQVGGYVGLGYFPCIRPYLNPCLLARAQFAFPMIDGEPFGCLRAAVRFQEQAMVTTPSDHSHAIVHNLNGFRTIGSGSVS